MVHKSTPNTNMIGQMKFNSCGYQLALAGGMLDTVQVFSFSKLTGQVTNPITIPVNSFPYGIEFSAPVNNMLYVTTSNSLQTLVQYDLYAGSQPSIIASKSIISTSSGLTAIQSGPDGNLYVSKDGSNFIGRINNSSSPGASCNFVINSINLDPLSTGIKCSWGLPSFAVDNYFPCGIVGIHESEVSNDHLSMYPNPTTDEFHLIVDGDSFAEVFSLIGVLVEKFSLKDKTEFSFGQNYPPGVYYLKINDNSVIKAIKN
jgi:hypothetical protein